SRPSAARTARSPRPGFAISSARVGSSPSRSSTGPTGQASRSGSAMPADCVASRGWRPRRPRATQRGMDDEPAATAPIRLTDFARAAGCAAKLGPADLSAVLATLPQPTHPDVLVGTATSDDAGVFRLTPDLALVQTVDFFTPIVDDPFRFGAVA